MHRPLPQPTPETQPFWDGAREGVLRLPRCLACGRLHFYPRAFCPHCGSRSLDWQAVSGRGTIYTFTVNHRPAAEAFASMVPYAVAVVTLAEGPRMMGRVVDSPIANVRIGAAVAARFEPVAEGLVLVNFALETDEHSDVSA
ncbi:MAG: Zn-ribbon domain-containing OB-fold protein [Burkholderiaceae bacterium]